MDSELAFTLAVERLKERRARLAAEIEQGKADYAEIERILAAKMRSIDMDVGGLKILDELLVEIEGLSAVSSQLSAISPDRPAPES